MKPARKYASAAAFRFTWSTLPKRSFGNVFTASARARPQGVCQMRLVVAGAGGRHLLPAPSFLDGFPARRERRRQKHTFAQVSSFDLSEQFSKPLRELSLMTQFRYFANGNQSALPPFCQGLFDDVV